VRELSPELLTAYHEAGHAVVAELHGEHISRVEIVGDEERSGSTETLRFPADPAEGVAEQTTLAEVENRLRSVLSGTVAEAMISGREDWDEGSEDLDEAVRLAMKLVDDCEDVLPLLADIRIDLEAVLAERWYLVERLAEELMRRKTLSGAEVRRIINDHE
jgi:hypothetical protein